MKLNMDAKVSLFLWTICCLIGMLGVQAFGLM